MENKPNKSIGYRCGYIFGCVVTSCVTILASSAVIALTAKAIIGFLTWLF